MWIERQSVSVERFEVDVAPGSAHDDASAEPGQIEGMKRAAQLVQNEIGDVDDVVDGAQADRSEPGLEPLRTGGDLDPANDARGVQRAAVGGIKADLLRCGTLLG